MPKRSDINSVLIIGSGPIVIGQACEFDYSGTQACKALRKLGYKIILVNSNPATIMTDPETADVTYIEPLNPARLEQIIAKERPDALLPNLGGQSGLNLCSELWEAGILEKYGVKVIGVQPEAIKRGEDRIEFKKTMEKLGIEMAKSAPAYSVAEALSIAEELGYPVVLRPAYTMGGAGGGLVTTPEELAVVCERGIHASMVGQVLVEESVLGWEELELEVVRDAAGQKITVCFIENIDPLGVHTGDSFCSAPMLTISAEVQAELQRQAYMIVDEVGVIGGTNVQFARSTRDGRVIVIEINPRTSRSSALASKATGFPIALVSAMLACGLTLDEIDCGKYGTLDKYVPGGDFVVIKFARWAFEKFRGAEDKLGTQMRAVGEVMAIGKTYREAFQKAIRSLETGRYGLGFAGNFAEMSREELLGLLKAPTSQRQFIMYEALRKGASVEELAGLTMIKPYFISEMKALVDEERALLDAPGVIPGAQALRALKMDGFSDKYLARLIGVPEKDLRAARLSYGITEGWEGVHVSGTRDSAYYFSTYRAPDASPVSNAKKVMILGGGPNRIGQGIEFDYCCVHAAKALKALGFETIMVNCNPETVSTDYDTSDKLYFEPLTAEDVLSIYEKEKPLGVICQFGGQTPLNIADELQAAGVRILGTPPSVIDMAEDRDLFRAMMEKLGIPMPEAGMASTLEAALTAARSIGYPVMLRPSFVLGGRGMEVVRSDAELTRYMSAAVGVTPDRPILIDRFLRHATECEADAVCDGKTAFVPAVMEHVELAGVHSGDSACLIPSQNIPAAALETINSYTKKIACEMGVRGLMNIQYAIENGKVYVIEANPRASRTVPLVSKVCNIRMVPAAINIITEELTGERFDIASLKNRTIPYVGVKEAVFPFNMFPEVDPVLGPEMRSTGEALGLARSFGDAFLKAEEAANSPLPREGRVYLSAAWSELPDLLPAAQDLTAAGFALLSGQAMCEALADNGVSASPLSDAEAVAAIDRGDIALVIETLPSGEAGAVRRAAIRARLPYVTTAAAARASALALKTGADEGVCSLQELHSSIM